MTQILAKHIQKSKKILHCDSAPGFVLTIQFVLVVQVLWIQDENGESRKKALFGIMILSFISVFEQVIFVLQYLMDFQNHLGEKQEWSPWNKVFLFSHVLFASFHLGLVILLGMAFGRPCWTDSGKYIPSVLSTDSLQDNFLTISLPLNFLSFRTMAQRRCLVRDSSDVTLGNQHSLLPLFHPFSSTSHLPSFTEYE